MQQDGDVVLTAAGVREVDERVRRRAHILTARDLRDLLRRDVSRETVAAEQETVCRTQSLDEDVGLDAAYVTGEARDRVRRLTGMILSARTAAATIVVAASRWPEEIAARSTAALASRIASARASLVARSGGAPKKRIPSSTIAASAAISPPLDPPTPSATASSVTPRSSRTR